jgi:hypothetical protein
VIYIKDEKGRLLSLKEIAFENNVPLKLVQGRYNSRKLKSIEELTQEKYAAKSPCKMGKQQGLGL